MSNIQNPYDENPYDNVNITEALQQLYERLNDRTIRQAFFAVKAQLGNSGASITKIDVDENNYLIFTLSNGSTVKSTNPINAVVSDGVQADFEQADSTADDFIKNKPKFKVITEDEINELAGVADGEIEVIIPKEVSTWMTEHEKYAETLDEAIEQNKSDISNVEKEIARVETSLQNQIDGIVIEASGSGDVTAEVTQARVNASGTTFETLKARLDAADIATAEMKCRNYVRGVISIYGFHIDTTARTITLQIVTAGLLWGNKTFNVIRTAELVSLTCNYDAVERTSLYCYSPTEKTFYTVPMSSNQVNDDYIIAIIYYDSEGKIKKIIACDDVISLFTVDGEVYSTEVTDARTGYEGTKYNSLGIAVRTQFNKFAKRYHNYVIGTDSVFSIKINTAALTIKFGIVTSGILWGNTSFKVVQSSSVTSLECTYEAKAQTTMYCYSPTEKTFYTVPFKDVSITEDDLVIAVLYTNGDGTIKKIIACDDVLKLISVDDVKYITEKPETIGHSLTGRKMCVYGDSITKNPAWSNIVKESLSLGTVYNRGWSDSAVTMENKTLYINPDGTYNNNPISVDVQPEGTTAVQCSFCHDDRIAYVPTDTEVVLVMGGTNDLLRYKPIGSITTDGVNDESTFTGALISTVQKIQARLPNATIILMTPITKPSAKGEITPYINSNQNTIVEFVEAVHKVADYVGCPLIDVHKCGITLFNNSSTLHDGTHPSDNGINLIAKSIIGGLKQIFTV